MNVVDADPFLTLVDDMPTAPDSFDESGPDSTQTTRIETLLFGLSLAAALPPTAMLVSPSAAMPSVQAEPHPLLDSAELAAILDRTTTEIGRGRVGLAEIDQRLHRLVVSLGVYQATDQGGVLVCLGIVSPDRATDGMGGVTPTGLWTFAHDALVQYGVICESPSGDGEDALLVVYGGITAQVVWLAGDHLATASVTSLDGDEAWVIESAHAIASALDRRLR